MNVEDLAYLLGKTKQETVAMLKETDVIELNLSEKNRLEKKEDGEKKGFVEKVEEKVKEVEKKVFVDIQKFFGVFYIIIVHSAQYTIITLS